MPQRAGVGLEWIRSTGTPEGGWVLSRVKLEVDHQVPRGSRRSGSHSEDADLGPGYCGWDPPENQKVPTRQAVLKSCQAQCEAISPRDHQVRSVLLSFLSPPLQPWKDQKPPTKQEKEKSPLPRGAGFLPKAGPIWGRRERTDLSLGKKALVTEHSVP